MASGFDRDFGYLLPFLDRVVRAAGDHPDAQVRAELSGLVADQKRVWTRIRTLLSERPGEAPEPSPVARAPGPKATRGDDAVTPRTTEPSGANVTAAGPLGLSLTVGNLRRTP